jgi:hypothetical protein
VQVIPITFEDVVLFDAYFDKQVTGWATVGAWLAIACATNAHAVINASWDFDFQCFLFFDLALAMATAAGIGDDFACATAMGAGLLHTEKALTHLHLTAAMTSAAGFG